MNEILQKRIEEAAKKYAKQFEQVGYDDDQIDTIEEAIIYGAILSLQNQWISVEEGLPDKGHDVLVAVLNTKTNTHFYGFDAIVDDSVFLRDKNGFTIDVNYHEITHWMEIPSLEGGEK